MTPQQLEEAAESYNQVESLAIFLDPDVASSAAIGTRLQNKVSSIRQLCVAPDIPRLLVNREHCLVAVPSGERKGVLPGMIKKLKKRPS